MNTRHAVLAILLLPFAGPATALSTQYEVSFQARWTADLPRPGSAHFTTLVGGTHNADGSLLAVGQPASPGVEQVAELGGGIILTQEIQAHIDAGNADQHFFGTDFFIDPEETNTFTITVSDQFPLLTMLTMIAPSPDWFTGVHGLSLIDGQGDFIPRIERDLPSYDAGTEDGTGLSLNNPATVPQGVIQMLDAAEPNGALFGAGSIARLTLTRLLPGDTDRDGDIDDTDLGTAFSNYTGPGGAGKTTADGDTDSDGDIDDTDLGSAFSNYTGPTAPASVPEPGSFALLTAAGIALVMRRRPAAGV
ncbi:MAG: spondin domain-containing protein [Phycisphaeraceae bacterium]